MAAGMFEEGREVYVTAFCNDEEVLRCTANVGNVASCRPTDDVLRWADHAHRVGAHRIRHLAAGARVRVPPDVLQVILLRCQATAAPAQHGCPPGDHKPTRAGALRITP